MKNGWILLLWLPLGLHAQVLTIQAARQKQLGEQVTIRGVVTNGYELGKTRYLQDGTAGLAAFPGDGSVTGFESSVSRGDSVEITGILDDYYGLLQINPILNYTDFGPTALPLPKEIDLNDLSESIESQLVSVDCIIFGAAGGDFSGNATHAVRDLYGQTASVYLRSGHPLVGDPIPGDPVRLVGIVSQSFGYQLLPRNAADFPPATCFYFTDPPEQAMIGQHGFRLSWKTNLPATATLHYGSTPALGTSLAMGGPSLSHTYQLSGLLPGTIYWVQVSATMNGQVIYSEKRPFATASTSSGQVKVYFSHDINPSAAGGQAPEGQTAAAALAETLARIQGAQQTIDVAMYNNNRSDLTNALRDAHARGVRVRYVAALDATNSALNVPPPFPVIYGNEFAIMHDKFMVIDVELPDQCWVMTGSMNWTTQNIFNDFNNLLFIQDQSLARAYTLEFEEMWGSSGPLPNENAARFSSAKRDNTPHDFMIGGQAAQLWFSPSDRTTDRIAATLYDTDSEAVFGLFSFTNNQLADALVDQYLSGRQVRGIMENIDDTGAEYNFLNTMGVDCQAHPMPGEFHHKYAVVDADGNRPMLITGSHNWSFAAETVNDENTLIIQSERLAALFRAEFEQRWLELTVSAKTPDLPAFEVYPNPVTDELNVEWPGKRITQLSVFNAWGLPCLVAVHPEQMPLSLAHLPAGLYFLEIQFEHGRSSIPFQKI